MALPPPTRHISLLFWVWSSLDTPMANKEATLRPPKQMYLLWVTIFKPLFSSFQRCTVGAKTFSPIEGLPNDVKHANWVQKYTTWSKLFANPKVYYCCFQSFKKFTLSQNVYSAISTLSWKTREYFSIKRLKCFVRPIILSCITFNTIQQSLLLKKCSIWKRWMKWSSHAIHGQIIMVTGGCYFLR